MDSIRKWHSCTSPNAHVIALKIYITDKRKPTGLKWIIKYPLAPPTILGAFSVRNLTGESCTASPTPISPAVDLC